MNPRVLTSLLIIGMTLPLLAWSIAEARPRPAELPTIFLVSDGISGSSQTSRKVRGSRAAPCPAGKRRVLHKHFKDTRMRQGPFWRWHCHGKRQRPTPPMTDGPTPPSAPAPDPTPNTTTPTPAEPEPVIPPPTPPPDPARMSVTLREWSIVLTRDTIPSGEAVLDILNRGEDPHDLRLSDGSSDVEISPEMDPGTHARLRTTLRPGQVTLYCSLPGHRELGMQARLTVESPK